MNEWKKIKIGEFFHRIKRPIKLESDKKYKLVTIKLHHNGVVLRQEKLGAEIKSKMYQIRSGDFILSGIDARNGAFGIVPNKLDGAIVTNDFWYFDINEKIIEKNFFLELTSTQWFDEICRKGSDGTTQRIRLQKNKFFNQHISIPSIKDQELFISKFRRLKADNTKLISQLTHQKTLLKKLRQQILQEAIEGKLTAEWRTKNSPPPEGCPQGGVVSSPPKEYSKETSTSNLLNESPQTKVVNFRNTVAYKSLPYNPQLKDRAKELRKAGNLSEVLFWNRVKRKQFKGYDFDRQKIIGNYIVDFYCSNLQVVIEIDGRSHDKKQEYDATRDKYLGSLGLQIIHISDADIKKNLDGIMLWLNEHPAFHSPPPEGRPQGGVVSIPTSEGCPQGGVVSTSPEILNLREELKQPQKARFSEEIKSLHQSTSLEERKPPRQATPATPPEEGNCESASKLLERIKAEKDQLIKEGKIKKQKPLPPITEEEKPFALPEGWAWCRLGDLVLMNYGRALTKSQTSATGKYPVYGSNGIVGYYDKNLTNKKSIIIGRKGSAGAIQISNTGSWTTDVAYYIEESNLFNFQYLVLLLKALNLENLGKGIKPGLNRNEFYFLSIAFPPLVEQKAIVAKVEKLLALCDQLEAQIASNQAHADQLMQAVLKEAFTQSDKD